MFFFAFQFVAFFVDVIHTDAGPIISGGKPLAIKNWAKSIDFFIFLLFDLGLGLMQPIGHIDYYPNG